MSSSEEVLTDDSEFGEIIENLRSEGLQSEPNGAMYVAIVTAMFGAIMFGIDTTNFGAVVDFQSFEDEWCIPKYGNVTTCDHEGGAAENTKWLNNFVSWANLLVFLGAAFGAVMFGPPIAKNQGRRPCISAGAGITFVGCLMTSYVSMGSVPVFFAGRLITGMGIGLCCFALPMYNAEVSAPSIRGTTGSLFQLFVALGGLLAAVLTAFCSDWKIGMMMPGFAAIIVMFSIWLTPESPRFVMARDGYDDGLEQLEKVRNGDATKEANDMYREIEEEAEAGQVSYSDLFTQPNLRKRVAIACWMQIAQQFTGMNTIIMYSGTLFRSMGFDDPLVTNLIFNVFMVIGMVIGLFLLDSEYGGRRSQLKFVTIIIAPLLILTGIAIKMEWSNNVVLALVCSFALIWQLAWGMIPWLYPSEIFSTAERDRAVSLAVFTQYIANAVLLYLVPMIKEALEVSGTMIFFGCFNILNFLFVHFYVKETKGLPLEDIPILFNSKRRFREWLQGKPVDVSE